MLRRQETGKSVSLRSTNALQNSPKKVTKTFPHNLNAWQITSWTCYKTKTLRNIYLLKIKYKICKKDKVKSDFVLAVDFPRCAFLSVDLPSRKEESLFNAQQALSVLLPKAGKPLPVTHHVSPDFHSPSSNLEMTSKVATSSRHELTSPYNLNKTWNCSAHTVWTVLYILKSAPSLCVM